VSDVIIFFVVDRGKAYHACLRPNATTMEKITNLFISYKSINLFLASLLTLFLYGHPNSGFAQYKDHGVNIGLVYPLSTHGTQAGEYTNVFSLHGIAGVSLAEKGFTVSGISNIIHQDARGFQVAGISNHIGGYAEGFKAAGIINLYKSGKGFQAAGVINFADNNVTGMQAAGVINKASDVHGMQAAGFMNMAGNVRGTQAASYINIAGDVEGAQLAGFLNIAKKVKGIQAAGFINIADSSDFPIGVINIIKNGEKAIGITTDDNLTTMVAFRSGSRKLYGIIGLGYNFQNTKQVFARQFGIGAHLVNRNVFRLNAEATTISLENFKRGEFAKFSLSVLPALKLGSKLEIFGGPSFNLVNTNTDEGKKLVNHYIWNDNNSHNRLNGLYVGYTAGIQMKF
jgi:hypothetical protein